MIKKFWTILLGAGLFTALAAIPSSAQTTPPAGGNGATDQGGGGGGRKGRGNFDPAQYRQQRMDDLMKALDIKGKDDADTKEQQKFLQTKLEKVDELRNADRVSRFMGFGGGGRTGRGQGGGAAPAGDAAGGGTTPAIPGTDSAVAKAAAALKAAIDSKASDDTIKEKLLALRDARAKLKEELTKLQASIKALVNDRQEAVLVAQGYLE